MDWLRATRSVTVATVLGTALAGQDAVRASFERILWLQQDPPRDAAFFARVGQLGFSAVSVSRGGDAAVPSRHGLRFYGDQIAGKGILELRDSQWRPLWKRFSEARDQGALVRPTCLSSASVRAELATKIAASLDDILPHGPLAISIGDEASYTSHANPFDFCAGPECLREFREFLARSYADAATLAVRWGGTCATFDDVEPWTTDRIRARELRSRSLPKNLEPWNARLEFSDRTFAAAVARGISLAEERAPDLPVGLTGIQPPSAFGGHDYAKLLPLCSFYEAYDIGGARDLAMCLVPDDALQVQTLFPPAADDPPRLVEARVFDLLAHGIGGVIVWSAADAFGADGEPSPFGRAVGAAFRSSRNAHDAFGRARIVRSSVWLIESQPSIRAHWMLDSAGDGRTWVRRLSSYEAEHSTSLAARRSWVRLLEDLGLQGRFVAAERLRALLADERPQALVLPACLALSDLTVAAIREYVRAGGTLIADHGAAIYDQRLRRRDRGALDDVFGIRGRSFSRADQLVRQGRPSAAARLRSGAAAAERGLAGPLGEPTSCETQVQFEVAFGRGRALYLNLAVCEYAGARLAPERIAVARDIRRRVRHGLAAAGVRPPVAVRGDGWPTCLEVLPLVARDGRELLAVRVNALENPDLMRVLDERGPGRVTLDFPAPVALRDVLTGEAFERADRFELELDPWRALLLEVRRGT